MTQTLAFDWEADYLAGIDADVSGETVRVHRCFRMDWPHDVDLRQQSALLGKWLAESLRTQGIRTDEAHVVLPREAIVVRKLDLPNAPDEELPDLVRFQAATKSSTPLEKLVLDYLPLPGEPGDVTRQVLMVTVEAARLRFIRETIAAAGISLLTVGISPVAVSEVVARLDREGSTGTQESTLVVFQDTHRVEITTLIQRQVIFTHHTRLTGSDGEAGQKSSIAEINRTVVALSQSLSSVDISRVCLIHPGNADLTVEESLRSRFGNQLVVLDVSQTQGVVLDPTVDRTEITGLTPALGALFGQTRAHVGGVDFLQPRRAVIRPDRRRFRAGLAAAATVLIAGAGYWMFSSYLNELDLQTREIEQLVEELDSEIRQGIPDQNAATLIGEWVEQNHDPLAIINRFNQLAPGTDRMYLRELNTETLTRDAALRITAIGFAVSQREIEQLQEDLEEAGFRVLPSVPDRSRVDPDYPFTFELQIEIPVIESEPLSTEPQVTLN